MKATLFLSVPVISMLIGGQAYGVIKIMPSELVEFAEKVVARKLLTFTTGRMP